MASFAMEHTTEVIHVAIRVAVLLLVVQIARYTARWTVGVKWLLRGPELLAGAYQKHGRSPFRITTPERQYVVVSSKEHIDEVSQANEEELSLVAVAEEVFQPVHTMDGIELNRLGMQRRILRTLTSKFSTLQGPLTQLVRDALADEYKLSSQCDGWKKMKLFNLTQVAAGKGNIYTFYGARYARDDNFLKTAMQYPIDVFIASEVLRCFPSFASPLVAWIVTRGHKASRNLTKLIMPIVFDRLQKPSERADDYIQHIIDLYPDRNSETPRRITQQTLALWFASVHQPALSLFYALIDICQHSEYQNAILEEISANTDANGEVDFSKLFLLDSFLKESARLNSSESISLRRKAMKDYTFKDGLAVSQGDWVCTPQRALMRDSSIYANGETFDGRRFLAKSTSDYQSSSKFTDMHWSFPFWGLGKQACPGRFYAVFIMKVVMVEIISKYEVKMVDEDKKRSFTWRSGIFPLPSAEIVMRRRDL